MNRADRRRRDRHQAREFRRVGKITDPRITIGSLVTVGSTGTVGELTLLDNDPDTGMPIAIIRQPNGRMGKALPAELALVEEVTNQ